MEYYSVIKKTIFESVVLMWMNLEPVIHSEVSQTEKDKYFMLMHICGIKKNSMMNLFAEQQQICRLPW